MDTDELRGLPGKYILVQRKGKFYVMLDTEPTTNLIGREVLDHNTSDSEWLFLAAVTIDMESKEVEKSRFF